MSKSLTTQVFIERSNKIHNNKYNYSKIEYKNYNTKVCIICSKHGEFWQTPHAHLSGQGCPICAGIKKHTTEEFIELARKVHGDKYNYSKVNYINNKTPICIICPEHGEFWQTPESHLQGKGCIKCAGIENLTTEDFIEKARKIHGDKYSYSKVNYVNNHTKVCIICPEHGEFWQKPNAHLNGNGCPKCCGRNKTTEEFIKEAKNKYGDKYDYSKTIYINARTPVCIICPEHGEFWQTPNDHLHGYGCKKCGYEKLSNLFRNSKEEIIERFKNVHGDKYDYSLFIDSKFEYKNNKQEIPIICKKHGIFWQAVGCHLNSQGCPKCQNSKLENQINLLLENEKIEFESQKTFDWLIGNGNGHLMLDFYLPKYNIAIECQGEQHFKSVEFWGGDAAFKIRQKNDKLKYDLCKERGINILYFADNKYMDNIITDEKILLNEIKNGE